MLARGLLCRLAVDVPKTSTHDLPRLSHLLVSTLRSRNGASRAVACALSRAYHAALLESRRSYATSTRATKPAAKAKKPVKKAAAKKKPVARTRKTKAVAKKKKPPKKAKPAKKKAKKVLTPEAKQKLAFQEYKKKALDPPKHRPISAWSVFAGEATKASKGQSFDQGAIVMKNSAAKYKALTAEEKEHYNRLANERNAAARAEYDAWIRSHTPEQIRVANVARAWLRARARAGARVPSSLRARLQDDRQVKRPVSPYAHYVQDRMQSGDFKGIKLTDANRVVAKEWKDLSPSEKKKYHDLFAEDSAVYAREFQKTYGYPSSNAGQ